jgi:hypothetical protein
VIQGVSKVHAYSREDRNLPLKAELDSDYGKAIEKGRFLTMLQNKYEERRLPINYEIEDALSIGKATSDGAAYKWKGVLFEGWKIRGLMVRISATFSRNHFYLELNQRVDKAIISKSRLVNH